MVETVESRTEVIARRIRELMAGRRLHGKDMAYVLGMSGTAFSRRVNGELEFLPSQIEALAQRLQVNEAYLYGFTEERAAGPLSGGGSTQQ